MEIGRCQRRYNNVLDGFKYDYASTRALHNLLCHGELLIGMLALKHRIASLTFWNFR